MDPMPLAGNDGMVWLALLTLLILATRRARLGRDDAANGEAGRFGLRALLGDRPDRSSFRYRR